jgi:hypothetical protein
MSLPSNLRLWHPSFDPYHCSFRLLELSPNFGDGRAGQAAAVLG